MLEVPEPLDTCQEELLTGSGARPRKEGVRPEACPDTTQGDAGWSVPCWFLSYFGSLVPHCASFPPVLMVMYVTIVCWKYAICFFMWILQGLQLRDSLESQKRL